MRVFAGGDAETGGAFTLAEFAGRGEGPWTVPHLQRGFEESFFILDGLFTFAVGDNPIEATAGMYVLVPRGTAHMISAAEVVAVSRPDGPGGLEEMFFALGGLGPEAIRDPAARPRFRAAKLDSGSGHDARRCPARPERPGRQLRDGRRTGDLLFVSGRGASRMVIPCTPAAGQDHDNRARGARCRSGDAELAGLGTRGTR